MVAPLASQQQVTFLDSFALSLTFVALFLSSLLLSSLVFSALLLACRPISPLIFASPLHSSPSSLSSLLSEQWFISFISSAHIIVIAGFRAVFSGSNVFITSAELTWRTEHSFCCSSETIFVLVLVLVFLLRIHFFLMRTVSPFSLLPSLASITYHHVVFPSLKLLVPSTSLSSDFLFSISRQLLLLVTTDKGLAADVGEMD
eukprot:756600-Hanusia_phi.AAC.5